MSRNSHGTATEHVKIVEFQVIHFSQSEGHPILIYALGNDGIMYELAGGRWAAYPIAEGFMRDPFPKNIQRP